jgi:hypothetical protein
VTGAMAGAGTGANAATAATAPTTADAVARSSGLGLAALSVRVSRLALLGVSLKLATSTEWKPCSAESGT